MPHWRSMTDSEYLHAGDLIDPKTGKAKKYTLEIASVQQGVLVGEGGRKTKKPIVRFKGARKPFGANSTNSKAISSVAGSSLTENWVGHRVTLFVTTTRAKGGEIVDCIRIEPKAPPVSKSNDEVPDRDEPVFDEQVQDPALAAPEGKP